MRSERTIRRYRDWYARLLRLYPSPYRERFAEGMAQSFSDVLRENARQGKGLFGNALRMFADTTLCLIRENFTYKDRELTMQRKNIIAFAIVTALILLIPLIAMQLGDAVVWTIGDFVFAGAVLFGAGLTYEYFASKAQSRLHRAGIGFGVLCALFLIWGWAAGGA